MRILVVCQYYKPEPFRISDICEEMIKRGHEVTVVTGVPNYPEGIIYDGYKMGKKREEVINGVKVYRCFTIPRKRGILWRFLNYYSYSISSSQFVKKCVNGDEVPYDVVFVNQLSPVMMANAAIVYKRQYKIPIVMYCLDLWPESLIAGNVRKESLVYKYFHRVSKKIYCQMDKILVTSKMFSEYLQKEFGIREDIVHYLPQYAESIFEDIPQKEKNGMYDFMFAGNIGTAQSIDTILDAAKILQSEYENVRWHIVGAGSELERLKKIALERNQENVVFHGRKKLEEMPKLYAMADAMLISLKAEPVLSLTLPGKVQSYMAAGKPIIGAINGETATVIKEAKCGFCGEAENVGELVRNIRRFIEENDKEKLGQHSRCFYLENFDKRNFIEKLEEEVILCKKSH